MKIKLLKKINNLLLNFKNLDKYKNIKLPLLKINDFKKVDFTNRDELRNSYFSLSYQHLFNITATSGTVTTRLMVVHSKRCYECHLQRVINTYRCIGIKKDDICLNICSYSLNSGGRIMENAFKAIGAIVIPFGAIYSQGKLEEAIALIKQFKPNIINSYTNQLHDIFSILKTRHTVKKCIVNGEPLFNSYKSNIGRLSGAAIYNNYGSMEFSGFAITENPRDDYMRLFDKGLIIEVMHENGETTEIGEGDIVVTDLENDSMPFIRYMLGDRVEIVRKGQKKYIKVLGRSKETVLVNGEVFSKIQIIDAIQKVLKHPNFFIVIDKNPVSYKDTIYINILNHDSGKNSNIKEVLNKDLSSLKVIIKEYSGNIPKTSTGKYRHIIDLRNNDEKN